jgi:hypothetical protein
VPVKRLNEQVKRNAARFPHDFAFVPTKEGAASLGNRQNKAKQPCGIAASINRPVITATSMRRSSTCGACAWVQPVTSGAWDSPRIMAAARSG